MTTPVPRDSAGRSSILDSLIRLWDRGGLLVLYLSFFGLCSLTIPHFLDPFNLTSLAQSVCSVGIVSCGMLFCLVSGDFDLSVGSVAALSAIVAVLIINATGSVALGIATGVATGAAFGFCNGFIVATLGINALITTLATMQIVRGLAHIAAGPQTVGSRNTAFNHLFGSATFLHVRSTIWLMAGCFCFAGVLFHTTTFGRKTLAIGGNIEAARRSGIGTIRTKILVFSLVGAFAAIAGIIQASELQNADPKAFADLALAAISACVLGGVSLTGGVGSILAVIVGTLIMGTAQNVMDALQIDAYRQYLFTGGILLAAAIFDRFKSKFRNL